MTTEKPPLSNQGEPSREAVANRLASLDDYGKLELFSTCHNCASGKSTLTFMIQILTIALLIACLSIILPIRQSQLERYPFQDGTYNLRSVSKENGQYDITLVLAEGTDITEAKSASVSEDSDYEPESHTEGGITYTSLQPGERYELHSEERYHMTLSEFEVQVQSADDGTQRVEKKSSILGTRYILHM